MNEIACMDIASQVKHLLHTISFVCCERHSKLFNIFFYFRLERDAKLGALEERADALQDGAAQFEKQAASMKNKFWLENLKSRSGIGRK